MKRIASMVQFATAVASAFALPAAAATVDQPPIQVAAGVEAASTVDYWTPERMRTAKSLTLAVAGPLRAKATMRAPGTSTVVPGADATVEASAAEAQQLFQPEPQGNGASPALVGTGGLPYTTNRLYPQNSNVSAVYPYKVVGQLFFKIGNGNFVCTASVIRFRVIATAGHCVSDGNGNFYSNFLFVPALDRGVAPYLKWTWSTVTTTNNWFHGGGGVPNIQDDALIVLRDQSYRGAVHRIGEITGYLGYEYNARLPTHITQLGYPCNLDSCSDPISTSAQLYSGPSNNFQWGTAQLGGSSGGPEIQDFGQRPKGIPSEILGGNILTSVTSYLFTNPSVQVEGGSILGAPGQFSGNTFGDLINSVCATARNC